MRFGGHQVGEEECCLAAAAQLHALHIFGVAGDADEFDAGRDGAIAFEQRKFSGGVDAARNFREYNWRWSRSLGRLACSYSPRWTT